MLITPASNRNGNMGTKIKATKPRKMKWKVKLLHEYFNWLTGEIVHEKIWLCKRNIKRETESFIITAKTSVMSTNHFKGKIDGTQPYLVLSFALFLFPIFIISMAHFSVLNFIPIYWLCILIVGILLLPSLSLSLSFSLSLSLSLSHHP